MVDIVKIERVQNPLAYQRYMRQKAYLETKYGRLPSLESKLFHGTKKNPPESIMNSEEGFDMRFSNGGMWGRGVYFAKKFKYSHGYSYKIDSFGKQKHQVFLAKVLTGKMYNSRNNRGIKIPPTDENTGLRYDSVCGETGGTKVHIVYENGLSYPEYLITYTATVPENSGNGDLRTGGMIPVRRNMGSLRNPLANPLGNPLYLGSRWGVTQKNQGGQGNMMKNYQIQNLQPVQPIRPIQPSPQINLQPFKIARPSRETTTHHNIQLIKSQLPPSNQNSTQK